MKLMRIERDRGAIICHSATSYRHRSSLISPAQHHQKGILLHIYVCLNIEGSCMELSRGSFVDNIYKQSVTTRLMAWQYLSRVIDILDYL